MLLVGRASAYRFFDESRKSKPDRLKPVLLSAILSRVSHISWHRIQNDKELDMYRSDVVGSLLRPTYLKKAREEFAAGRLADAEFKRLEDRAVDEAVALQLRTGLDALSDGEMRRYAFFGHLVD